MRLARRLLLPLSFLLAAPACGGDQGPASDSTDFAGFAAPPGLKAEFTHFPIEMTADGTIEPLGHLNPPGHTLPTDHVYFYPVNYDVFQTTRDTITRKVFAPAGGVLFAYITFPGLPDVKLMFRTTKDFHYYLDHVIPRAGLKVGDVVQAGEQLGVTNPGAAIDLGAFDFSTPKLPGFVTPARYSEQTLHCVSPFKYFVEPLRSQLYARQRRKPGASSDPRIDFDVPGRLVGGWFDSTLPATADGSNGPTAWALQLAFVPDNYDPSLPRIVIGGVVSRPFIGTIPGDAPRFEDVSVASGKVTYSVRYTMSTQVQFGLMIVQMIDESRIRVEVFESETLRAAEFDSRARVYTR